MMNTIFSYCLGFPVESSWMGLDGALILPSDFCFMDCFAHLVRVFKTQPLGDSVG